MLLQRLLLLLPEAGPAWRWGVWAAFFAFGVALWIFGARFSRSLICLTLVTAGAILGKFVPATGLKVDPMAATLGAALILGILGYAFHRWVVALSLGALLALWAILGAWITSTTPSTWEWPTSGAAVSIAALKLSLGAGLSQEMVGLAALGCISGVAMTLLFPRLATTLFWTLMGATIALPTAIAYCAYVNPAYLDRVPPGTQPQCIVLGAVVVAGWIIQAIQQSRPAVPAAPAPAAAPSTAMAA